MKNTLYELDRSLRLMIRYGESQCVVMVGRRWGGREDAGGLRT